MARTRVRWGRAGIAAGTAVLAVSLLAGRAGAGGSVRRHPETERSRIYVVRQGDTLWSIASRLVGPTGDPRPVVDRLARMNHAESGLIRVGQALVISAP